MTKIGPSLGLVDLISDVPQIETCSSTNLGPVDLSSDVPPIRGFKWSRVVLHQVHLTFAQPLGQAGCWSFVPWFRFLVIQSWVLLTFSQMYPPVEASSGQEQYYITNLSPIDLN